ncbi:MAG: hypothetical protein K5837_05320 [Candidatus Saccharibacteria bacterium]|nr:hypothetical protein [Candidatus Saccharibacteria bacterium]
MSRGFESLRFRQACRRHLDVFSFLLDHKSRGERRKRQSDAFRLGLINRASLEETTNLGDFISGSGNEKSGRLSY